MVRKKDLRGGGQEREEAGSERERHGEKEIKEEETIKHTHTWTHTHTHRVREHNSEVTTVFFFFPAAVSVGGMCEQVRVCMWAYSVYLLRGGWGVTNTAARPALALSFALHSSSKSEKWPKLSEHSGWTVCVCVQGRRCPDSGGKGENYTFAHMSWEWIIRWVGEKKPENKV